RFFMKLYIVSCIVFCVLGVSCTQTTQKSEVKNEKVILYASHDSIQYYLNTYQQIIKQHDSLTAQLQKTIQVSERLVQLKYRAPLSQIEYKIDGLRNAITQFSDSSQVAWEDFQMYVIEENNKIEMSLQTLQRTLENL